MVNFSEFDTQQFYFVSSSYFYEDSSSIYPAELAFVKFSLKEGVMKSLSIRINPGELPLGSTYLAKKHAQETHRYPLPEDDEYSAGETNYIKILVQILDFIETLDEFPIFFTEGNSEIHNEVKILENTRKVLAHVCEEAGEFKLAKSLKIYSIYELLFFLKKKVVNIKELQLDSADSAFSSVKYAYDKYKATDSDFAYSTIGCDYHSEQDISKNCCLSKAKRYGYILSKWCCQENKYELKPGCHFPA